MSSKTSFFNSGISKNLLKRCWPLWTTWFVFLLLTLPISLHTGSKNQDYLYTFSSPAVWAQQQILRNACSLAISSFVFCILVAMVMFSFLYNTRTCGMMASLPVKREALYATVWLTGIIPVLAADILAAVLTLLCFPDLADTVTLLRWFCIVAMGNIAFYGFAVFCATLTGSIIILPLVYGVLSITAEIVEITLNADLQYLVYGFVSPDSSVLEWFSPVVMLSRSLKPLCDRSTTEFGSYVYTGPVHVYGLSYLVCIFAAGILFSVFGLLLFRRRRMETASDTVAVPVLKPIFKYCLAFGCALVVSAGIVSVFFPNLFHGRKLAAVLGLLMIAGLFIGYFAALMLMRKSLRVFSGEWKGFLISCAVCIAFTVLAEFDVLGLELQVPELDEVEHVSLFFSNSAVLDETENLEAALQLHQDIIDHKELHESSEHWYQAYITWTLKDGRTLSRSYSLACNPDAPDPLSDFWRGSALTYVPEALLERYSLTLPITADTVSYAALCCDDWATFCGCSLSSVFPGSINIPMDAEQVAALYKECVLPDLEAGRIGNTDWLISSPDDQLQPSVTIALELWERTERDNFGRPVSGTSEAVERYDDLYITLSPDSLLTLPRVREIAEEYLKEAGVIK